MSGNVLLVEDDERIIEFVRRGLQAEGYQVTFVREGRAALVAGRSPEYDVILLDRRLPDIEGGEVCRELRAAGVKTSIIMVTAMDAVDDRVAGLRGGADDYITKPFAFDELLARIEALLRRRGSYETPAAELVVGDLTLDRRTHEVRRADRLIELTPKEFALLEYLMASPGTVRSKTRIIERVWGYSADPLTNVVEVFVSSLRRKLDEGEPTRYIETVRGVGYRFRKP